MTRLMAVLTALLLGIAVSGCGVAERSGAATGPITTAGEPTSAPPRSPVVSVTYEKSGGIAGVYERRVYSLNEKASDGVSRAEGTEGLRAASDPELRTLEMTPLPEDQCCDRFSYAVTITWKDGTARTYESLDGVEQPPAFYRLLHHLP